MSFKIDRDLAKATETHDNAVTALSRTAAAVRKQAEAHANLKQRIEEARTAEADAAADAAISGEKLKTRVGKSVAELEVERDGSARLLDRLHARHGAATLAEERARVERRRVESDVAQGAARSEDRTIADLEKKLEEARTRRLVAINRRNACSAEAAELGRRLARPIRWLDGTPEAIRAAIDKDGCQADSAAVAGLLDRFARFEVPGEGSQRIATATRVCVFYLAENGAVVGHDIIETESATNPDGYWKNYGATSAPYRFDAEERAREIALARNLPWPGNESEETEAETEVLAEVGADDDLEA